MFVEEIAGYPVSEPMTVIEPAFLSWATVKTLAASELGHILAVQDGLHGRRGPLIAASPSRHSVSGQSLGDRTQPAALCPLADNALNNLRRQLRRTAQANALGSRPTVGTQT